MPVNVPPTQHLRLYVSLITSRVLDESETPHPQKGFLGDTDSAIGYTVALRLAQADTEYFIPRREKEFFDSRPGCAQPGAHRYACLKGSVVWLEQACRRIDVASQTRIKRRPETPDQRQPVVLPPGMSRRLGSFPRPPGCAPVERFTHRAARCPWPACRSFHEAE